MSTRRLLAIAALAGASLLLTGCGAGPSTVTAVTPEITAPESDAEPADGDELTDGPADTPTLLPPAIPADPRDFAVPGWAQGVSFVSPSGNLSCGIRAYDGVLDLWGCAIREHDWRFPSSSPGDYCYASEIDCGNGIVWRGGVGDDAPAPLMRGGAEFADEAGYPVKVLQYGYSVTFMGVTCASTDQHVVCEDPSTGHGLVISRNENLIY
ncbi:MAG TPA: hypothetical protein VNR36_03035 [Pseudolysinimonas sp.]|nr:hypothetical protein [Pseudolysinimonas sp.]